VSRRRLLERSSLVWAEYARLNLAVIYKGRSERLTTGFSGETVHFRHSHWPSGMYGTP
jgi:hypothetical protein